MNDKITIQDIIDLLAEKHSMNKKDAELFVKGMFELIEEALASEKYVKVKGLGTFKLTEVDSRESVNISTGERIEIQGHTKISFTPDTSIRDLINKPFAHFETVILNEGTTLEDTVMEIEGEEEKEDVTEDTIQEIIEEKVTTVEATEAEILENKTSDVKEELLIESEDPISSDEEVNLPAEEEIPEVEESIPEPKEAIIEESVDVIDSSDADKQFIEEPTENRLDIVEDTAPTAETMTIAEVAMLATKEEKTLSEITANEAAETEQPEPVISTSDKPEEKKKKKLDLLNLIILLLVLIIIGLAFWFFRSENEPEVQTPTTVEQPKDTIPAQVKDTLDMKKDTVPEISPVTEMPNQTKQPEQAVAVTAPASTNKVTKATLADTIEYDITGTKTNYTLQEGETLIKVAIKFYGSKNFWPYIVKHNKSLIKDADRVPIGTTIRIPELTPKK